MSLRGQASTEYLVILGAVLLVSAITVSILALSSDTSSAQVQESAAYWRSTYPFIITSAKAVGPAIVLTLQNTADEPLWLDGISAEGTRMLFYEYSGDVFGASRCPNGLDSCSIPVDIGQSVTIAARGPSECLSRSFSLDGVQLTYSNLDLTGLLQQGDKPLAGFCSQKVNGIALLPPSPANDSWFSAGSSIVVNATIQGMPLSGLNFTWNESTTHVYDDSLVLAMNFDDVQSIGDTAGKVVDVSQYGNNGTIYGNTALLLHMDENDGYKAYDESRFGNNGTVYGNTRLLLHMDENASTVAYDASAYGNNGTCYSGGSPATCGWVSGKSGTAITLSGASNQQVLIPNSPSLNITGPLTIETWFKTPSTAIWSGLVNKIPAGGSRQGYMTYIDDQNKLGCYFLYNWTAGISTSVASSSNVTDNLWHHGLCTYDGTHLLLYLDGILQSTGGIYTAGEGFNSEPLRIGSDAGVYGRYFSGIIDEVGVYSRGFTESEVLDHYNSGRAKHTDWVAGKSGMGLAFDGVDDYVTISSAFSGILAGTSTVSGWLKTGVTGGALLEQHAWTSTIHTVYGLGLFSGYYCGNNLVYSAWDGYLGVYYRVCGGTSVTDNNWHHFAFVKNGTEVIGIYVDGVNSSYRQSGSPIAGGVSSNAAIGRANGVGSSFFNGTLDEIMVSSRALNATEVLQQYQEGKAKHADWTPDGKAGSAMNFDGVDDYVTCSGSSTNIVDNLTVIAWVKPNSVATNYAQDILGRFNSGTGGYRLAAFENDAIFFIHDVSNFRYAYNTLVANQWTQLAFTTTSDGASTTISAYANGQYVAQSTRSVAVGFVNSLLYVGHYLGYGYFNGSIDEVRIWNRSLSAAEIKQQYYSSLNKFAPDKWIFTATEQSVPAGTYGYSLVAAGNSTTDFTANRTVRVS